MIAGRGHAQATQEIQLRPFVDGVPALSWCLGPDGSLEFFNQRCLTYAGLSPEEVYSSGWKSTVHPDDLQQLGSWWRGLRQSKEPGETEARFRRFDGEYRWF